MVLTNIVFCAALEGLDGKLLSMASVGEPLGPLQLSQGCCFEIAHKKLSDESLRVLVMTYFFLNLPYIYILCLVK